MSKHASKKPTREEETVRLPKASKADTEDSTPLKHEIQAMLQADDESGKAARKKMIDEGASGTYSSLVDRNLDPNRGQAIRWATYAASQKYPADVIADLKPQDSLDEMLIHQALCIQERMKYLSLMATQQIDAKSMMQVSEAADRAANTFRRIVLAYDERRRPPQQSGSYTRIGQANFATQQVVQNGEADKRIPRNIANEQGSTGEQAQHGSQQTDLLPEQGREGITAGGGHAESTLASEHRPEN